MAYQWNYTTGAFFAYNSSNSLTGLSIASAADDVRPSNAAYVAVFGNDITGNGSRLRPFRTIAKANTSLAATVGIVIIGDGVYREGSINELSTRLYVANNRHGACLDGTGYASFAAAASCYNLEIRNWTNIFSTTTSGAYYSNCYIHDVGTLRSMQTGGYFTGMVNCRVVNVSNITIAIFGGNFISNVFNNNTFHRITNFVFQFGTSGTGIFTSYYNIISDSNVWVPGSTHPIFDYSIFGNNCNWRFNAAQGTVPSVLPPSVPSGYTNYSTLSALLSALTAAFPGANNFRNCNVVNPLYNNSSRGDLSLSPISPAKNWAYTGSFIGSEGVALNTDLANDIVDSSNITNTAGIITLTTDAVGYYVTRVVDLGRDSTLVYPNVISLQADRNGEALDYARDLSNVTISAGTGVLTLNTPYVVENASISWNGNSLSVGDKFTAQSGTGLDFTGSGVVREILHYPNARTVELRFKNNFTGIPISPGTAVLTTGSDYQVTGTITHNAVVYTNGQLFRAVNADFTGTGTVIKIFDASDIYYPFIINAPIKCNRTGNTSSGSITKGNGDPTFDLTAANQFNVTARYVQCKTTIQVDNLGI